MTENVENAIFDILKKIQADMSLFRSDVNDRFGRVGERMERLEDLMRKQRRDVAGILVMGKSTAGKFAEDLAALEKRMDAIEAGQH